MTGGHVDYEGSLSIDLDLMEMVGMSPYEKILVGNQANGERFETYAIPADRGSRIFQLNGACAHLGKKGDRLTIMSFSLFSPEEMKNFVVKKITLDDENRVVKKSGI